MLQSIRNILIFSLSLLIFSCGNKPKIQQGPQAVAVVTQKIEAASTSYYDEYPATIMALNQVELRPQVNGYVTGLYFTEGAHVKKGDKLYTIDQQQYEASYQQAQANLAVQEANLVKAQKDVDRYRELNKRDAIAKQQVDNAEANYEAAKKQVEAAQATVRSVQTNVRYTVITAPFDGTIGISQVKLGAAVSAGQTLLNTISSDNPIAADFVIDQKEIFKYTQLLKKSGTKDSTFSLSFNGEIYSQFGSISFIDRAVNPQTGTITVRVTFPNPDNLLRPGMAGTLRVLNHAPKSSVIIPYKAVTEQLGEFLVYKVKTDSNKVTQQRVMLGKQVDRNVIIKSGLQEGETIVTEGVQNLREGSMIAEKPASTEVKK
ncbi:MAG TPA: efflux RND transporter periplasmic adaptor subunit [Cytophagales bacterium]|jgi:membrane fusion protein, multidrug efflux system|nr:efflux RND transporter periplasmic adaptor subunit [Cytophagales bacterium]